MFDAPGQHRPPDDELTQVQMVSNRPLHADGRRRRAQGDRRSRWHWLVVVAVVVPLLTPLYNRLQPRLFGLPFFYWSQMAFIGLAACVTAAVYQATKRRGS
jgi:Protein of unknown function (DUF3311)